MFKPVNVVASGSVSPMFCITCDARDKCVDCDAFDFTCGHNESGWCIRNDGD